MLRLEAYNIFDYTQWGFPSNDTIAANFGRLTSQFNFARSLQAQVRFIF